MGHLVSCGKNGVFTYSGTQYENPVHGTKKLCIRTGSGSNGVVKYGLTSDSSASAYCGLKMKIGDNVARIGRSEAKTKSSSYVTTIYSASYRSSYTTSYSMTKTSKTTNMYSTNYSNSKTSSGTSSIVSGAVTDNISFKMTTWLFFATSWIAKTAGGKYSESQTYRTVSNSTINQTHVVIEGSEDGGGESHNFNL